MLNISRIVTNQELNMFFVLSFSISLKNKCKNIGEFFDALSINSQFWIIFHGI